MLISYAESRQMDEFCNLLLQIQKLGTPVMDGLCKFFLVMVERVDRLPLTLEVFRDFKINKMQNKTK